jgi:hypothetical protein
VPVLFVAVISKGYRMKVDTRKPEPWPPAWAMLPSTIAEIEHGRVVQGELFAERADDSTAARIERLTKPQQS